jgi:hypothetical protein
LYRVRNKSKKFREANIRNCLQLQYLVSERECLLLAEVEFLGVVVDYLRFRKPSSLHIKLTPSKKDSV